ncbi:MAG TPA: autotransporter domain-containing protein [Sphingomicrobium sp.]|nr:autotransporter domain-containing protein [Sphingomicrobium sp.]
MRNRRHVTRALLGASAIAFAMLPSPAAAQRVDRIVAFGDSYADDGNALQLGQIPAPFQPLYPTGRFTGGTNYVDTLSQLLGVPVENFAIGFPGARATTTFLFEINSFLAGGGGVAFPTVIPTFNDNDLVTVSIGGNDARDYGTAAGATVAGAPAAAAPAIAAATSGLNALVAAGAPTISFLAGDAGQLPEVAPFPSQAQLRSAYSAAFNSGMRTALAGYAANGVTVHYLDLTLVVNQVIANPALYGLTAINCPPFTVSTACVSNAGAGFLFYGDLLHPTSQGSAIIARYIVAQLQAPLTLQATSDLGLDTARQFGRTLNGRLDLAAPRDGDSADGPQIFLIGDTFSRDVEEDSATDAFDIDGYGVSGGVSFGFGNGVVGLVGNYSRPKAKFAADVSSTRSKSWQVGGFAGFGLAGGFVQGYAGYGQDDHRISRAGVVSTMTGSADGSHYLAGVKAGYLLPMGAVRIGPVAALDYAKAKVDGYTEAGDPALTLNVGSLSAKALTGSLAAELRGDFNTDGIQLRPFASAGVEMDFVGDGRTIRYAQTASPTIVNSWRFEDRSKKAYARFTGGASAGILSRVTLDAMLSGTVGQEQGDELSAHVGLKMGF